MKETIIGESPKCHSELESVTLCSLVFVNKDELGQFSVNHFNVFLTERHDNELSKIITYMHAISSAYNKSAQLKLQLLLLSTIGLSLIKRIEMFFNRFRPSMNPFWGGEEGYCLSRDLCRTVHWSSSNILKSIKKEDKVVEKLLRSKHTRIALGLEQRTCWQCLSINCFFLRLQSLFLCLLVRQFLEGKK